MNLEKMEQQKKQGGFTLVELAIVMIIIGLLIGGILKGQELIANSQTTATIAQIKAIDAATSTFRDKYSSLPGDMNPANRLANCTAAPCSSAGDADGRIEGASTTVPGTAVAIGNESVVAFSHMAAADLLSGIESNGGGATYGEALPEAKVGGGFNGIEYSSAGVLTSATVGRVGHYLIMNGQVGAVSATSGLITPARAAQIDRKLDDGAPNAGSVRSTNNCAAAAAATALYLESTDTLGCSMYLRIQG